MAPEWTSRYSVRMTRRTFCVTTLAALPSAAATESRPILVTAAQAAKLRQAANDAIRASVVQALKAGPWTVTSKRPENVGATPNDYYSEGPYWWPDPKNPSGPYIRKDGERYPGRFTANRNDLGSMCSAILSLGMGAWMLGDQSCGAHAANILSTWFLNTKTRMNPNLEYGQAVRGINTGRGTGLIDTVSFIHLVQGVWMLQQSAALDSAVVSGLKEWFAAFSKWMTSSSKGLDEKKSGNNHATWWTAQVAAYSAFTGDSGAQAMAWDHYRNVLVPGQIQPDGSCPREEARTNSLSYSAMNLDAFAVICRIAEVNGVALWNYRAPNGAGVEKAIHYLMPYLLHPDSWKKQQISKFNPDSTIFPVLAAVGLKQDLLQAAWRSLPHNASPWVQFTDALTK